MPRRPRVVLPHIPLHLIQRGNNRQVCFVADEDYRFYLDWLKEFAGKTGCRIHAYVLMTNHVHLLVSAERGASPGALMKALGQRYVQYFNRTYRRSGSLGRIIGDRPRFPIPNKPCPSHEGQGFS